MKRNYENYLNETLEALNKVTEEIADVTKKRDTALAKALTTAETTAVKALYRDMLAPLYKKRISLRAKAKRAAIAASGQITDTVKDSYAYKLFGKRRSELTRAELRAYNRWMQRRSRFLREMGGD